MLNKKKIIVTGSEGRLATKLKSIKNINYLFLSKKEFNILNISQMERKIKLYKPNAILHLAALSRPMMVHETNIKKSITINIIGTCNLVILCQKYKIKLIYASTNYVYSGEKKYHKETDSLLPTNNYSWSKLGGECPVHMYKNSLILRLSISEKPFIHKYAYSNIYSSFLYHDEIIKIIPKVIDKKGILNIGGKRRSIFSFARLSNKKVKKRKYKKDIFLYHKNLGLDNSKLRKILKNNLNFSNL